MHIIELVGQGTRMYYITGKDGYGAPTLQKKVGTCYIQHIK
jgi:hypothetical protein